MSDSQAHPVVVTFPPLDGRSASDASHQWYVASVRPRFEDKAVKRIKALGFGTFLPLAQQISIKRRCRRGRWYDEKRTKTVKAFPTYVFVYFDAADQGWRRIVQGDEAKRSGIRRFFGPDPERPRAVPAHEMDRLIRESQDRAMTPQQVESLIEIGLAYRVTEGPFAGHVGAAEAVQGKEVRLGLTVFGRPTRTKVSAAQLEKVL